MSEARLFGTDGIRGRAGEGWLSVPRVSAIGRAIGEVLATRRGADAGRTPRALLGHDGRRSGRELEAALARGLAAAGYKAKSAGLIPTPGLATLGRIDGFDLAVMISASHNPAEDNGIKVFQPSGEKLDDAIEDEIEARLREDSAPVEEGPAPELDSTLENDYLGYLLGTCEDLKLAGLSIVVDCANGGASRVAPRAFGRLGAHVLPVADQPDGENINQGCGATHLTLLQEEVRRQEAHVGVALDGDGDRCMFVEEHGEIINGDGILTACALFAEERGELVGDAIVATVMSNRGLHRALRDRGVRVHTVGVGDRRVVEGLREQGLGLGGEQSGHIVFGADNHHIGDGIYTALRVLRVMQETGRPLSELVAPYRPFPQVLINVAVASKPSLARLPRIRDMAAAIEQELGDDGRVLLRYSGTEPLARVMVEGPDAEWITERAQSLADAFAKELGGG